MHYPANEMRLHLKSSYQEIIIVAINPDKLLNLHIPEREQSYTIKDTILYALGCGFGLDPCDEGQLAFAYEKDLQALPMMASVLAYPGFWIRDLDTGIDWVKLLHGEQGLTLHKPLPVQGTVVSSSRVVDIIDKGEGRGALVIWQKELYDKASGDHLATVETVAFCRGDGGFGGPSGAQPQPHAIPDRAPDIECVLPTSPQAALIYRLSGDWNPLHAEPAVARAAGFERPILHGLATFGVAGHALLRSLGNYNTETLRSMKARFTTPVYPGETLSTEIWQEAGHVSFRVKSVERGVVAINNGYATLI